ncbi:uncharacterized protein EAF01_000526 [Botrytis porri]|uniref:Ecp2 effector protein domain-containing protein n=1 Tax=Botrytis porri TaxID=87229 RepID=A0A4Z1L107_9HELO|nr:uncharacterized protein EAF01_000526 [Botrytis porri]KAF7914120.1 hypothetical protein EAF01_000526 [Botrytis porri]TGO90495.1 hypothetical protein BPOR_0062g00150 [Botrytis porri]
MVCTARPSSLITLIVLVLLSIAFFSTVYALPAIDIGPIANPHIENTSIPTATLNERGRKKKLTWTSEAVAYTNCCQYTEISGETAFAINLAGWGNTDDTPNVVDTLPQDKCAPGLVENIKRNHGTIYAKTWICVPSYGAPGDTYVYFYLKKGDYNTIATALSQTHNSEPAWQCLPRKSETSGCHNQQGDTSNQAKVIIACK